MLTQTVFGMEFKNPVGLSEGFDKDVKLVKILPAVGFGFGWIGSITLKAYEGNPKPRLVRLPKSKGIVVNYGLKNHGVDKLIPKIVASQKVAQQQGYKVGISVAKTNCKETACDEDAIEDYKQTLQKLVTADAGDFYTLNISCPNTFGGEPFTTPQKLEALLSETDKVITDKPIFIKMPLNLKWEEFKALCDVAAKHNIKGLIIANLNKERTEDKIFDKIAYTAKGGISGRPTFDLSNELISHTYRAFGTRFVIIGVGGIFSAEDAYEKIKRGATLVQLITGMIFEGPQLIGDINRGLVKLLKKDGFKNISEAVGSNKTN